MTSLPIVVLVSSVSSIKVSSIDLSGGIVLTLFFSINSNVHSVNVIE